MKRKHYAHFFKLFLIAIIFIPTFLFSQVIIDKNGKTPSSIHYGISNQPDVNTFFKNFQREYSFSEGVQMKEFRVSKDLSGTHHRYDQYYKGIKVLGAQYILHEKGGQIWYANGHLVPDLDMDVQPAISKTDALQYALRDVNAKTYMWEDASNEAMIKKEQNDKSASFMPTGELMLTSGNKDLLSNNIKLVYRFDIYAQEPVGRYWVDVDAKTGEIVNKINRIHHGDVPGSGTSMYNGLVNITVDEVDPTTFRLNENTTRDASIRTYNMLNQTNYGAAVEFTSSSANGPWDAVGVNGHFGAEATYDYYFNEFGRNSLDDAGFALLSYVHRGNNYNNAFWDGSRMTYGDGDGSTFTPLVALDVCGHELTHGVTEFTSGLIYSNESGGLNESFSDIFGNLVEFYIMGEPGVGTGSWRIGEQITPGNLGIRNMANPNEFQNPDTYLGTYWFNNEVHNTSGVQNFWFYLLVKGGTGTNDVGYSYNVTGIGVDDAAAIAYCNNTSYLVPSSNYHDAREGAISCAVTLFGAGSQQALSTAAAWDAVGVYGQYDAEIEVSPPSLTFNLEVDENASDMITISNVGESGPGAPNLAWTILSTDATAMAMSYSGGEILNDPSQIMDYHEEIYDKTALSDEDENELNQNILNESNTEDYSEPGILGAGGPDTYGYQWIDSDDPDGPVYNWADITGTGTPVSLGDDASVLVSLPFNFPFYGNPKTEVRISSNGYLTFGIVGNDFSNDAIPNSNNPNDIICPFWDDLVPNVGGTVHYFSTPSQFVVQYTDVPLFSNHAASMTFQVILNDDGSIWYQYNSMYGTLNLATVGIENADASIGLQVAFNEAYIHDNLAVKISAFEPCPWITSVSPTSGSLVPGASEDVTVSVDATGLALGTYECELRIVSNAENSGLVIVPVTLNVVEFDHTPPVITVSNPITIWPPNRKYENFDLSELVVSVEDDVDGTIPVSSVVITSASSDEPDNAPGSGDGNSVNDIVIAEDCKAVDLRKERQGEGNGRVYEVHVSVSDAAGNVGTATCLVTVPHDQNYPAVNDGPEHTVYSNCGEEPPTQQSLLAGIDNSFESKYNVVNFPNPFKGTTTIQFTLEQSNFTKLVVYNSMGVEIATLFEGAAEADQVYKVEFNAMDLAGGVYFYRLQSGESINTMKKMMLVK